MVAQRPKKHKTRIRSLKGGRPPLVQSTGASLSSRATRSIIRAHHVAKKTSHATRPTQDAEEGETALAVTDDLELYQRASRLGQSSDRGGDTSLVLVDWLNDALAHPPSNGNLRMLEVGSLSIQNACSRVANLEVRRIDLRAQEPGIEEVDFMKLPIPGNHADLFDIVSLSLVLNFVPDPSGRGEMLKRVRSFLRPSQSSTFPCLFLVLPLACLDNSRYLTEALLLEMMASLGFVVIQAKKTLKLYYSLWRRNRDHASNTQAYKKRERKSGSSRNNFAIVLE